MVMQTMQIRIEKGLVSRMEDLVSSGIYSNKAEIVRDAVRRLITESLVGIIPNEKNSVEQIKELRKSMPKLSLEEINASLK
jgi:Arc/MetJ-type ribon-helix-helix transcriptional regulator